jgi:sRNA-binding protein
MPRAPGGRHDPNRRVCQPAVREAARTGAPCVHVLPQKRFRHGTFFPAPALWSVQASPRNLSYTGPLLGVIATTFTTGHDMGTKPTKAERKRQAVAALARLAELFPACFAVDTSGLHRPLKIGIHRDLIERGVQPCEAQALRLYTRRAAYQAALIAGGPRYDLYGNPHGKVTAEEIAVAKAALADIETRVRAAQEQMRAERFEHQKTNADEGCKTFETISMACIERDAKATGRLSLAGLKVAAQARKAALRAT